MKKIICIFIYVNMLICVVGVSSTSNVLDNIKKQNFLNDDILDQAQIVVEDGLPVGNFQLPDNPRYNWSIAQSYTPGLVVLTRVKLLLARNSIPPTLSPFVMTIRKTLTGINLAMVTVDPEEVLEFPDYGWVEFDFEDIPVDAGKEYFIVCYTVNETDNTYVWGTNPNDPYPAGQVYISLDNGNTWDGDPPAETADMCFMTYGRNNSPPEIPTIDGPPHGKPGIEYTFCITPIDPDGDGLYVKFDWGDGEMTPWLGPYESGTEICESHKWSKSGRYIIKVTIRDDYGATVTATLEITIPRTRTIFDSDWLRFFDMFPILQRFLFLIK